MEKLGNFKKEIKNKRVGLVGIGVSNLPVIEYLYKLEAEIILYDKNTKLLEEYPKLKTMNIKYFLGEDYLDKIKDLDYIFRSPGVKPFYAQIEEAKNQGTIITSEIEMLIHLAPCKIIGVTGSDGKTTTTTIISAILNKAGYKVWTGGNIGVPLFTQIDDIQKNDIIVLELSSFQLMTLKESPDISVITNISPNHLDYHRSYEEYIIAKSNIFKNQKKEGVLVLNLENEFSKRYKNEALSIDKEKDIRFFSSTNKTDNGVYFENNKIISTINGVTEEIIDKEDIKIMGIHNIENICTAVAAVKKFADIKSIKDAVKEFKGVEHRMELVREINGTRWYNDSIGTSPSRTIAGLKAFDKKIILIAGGYDKNIPYDDMGKYILEKVKYLILMGETKTKIEQAVLDEMKGNKEKTSINIINLETMEECVKAAYDLAKNEDIVVLSPASASFGMYKNFEIRGKHFKELVNNIEE
ncbi:MAG: UDP-N-acetylmuramoyl-L-alanine--D-glutamate ligase [Clostridia bacterium]|nr:UDP-N-acetylmuramoyl-L-alanine--D-glutamate ligase [Clostridia bacterium]MDD4375432.1 UDP-N-acetylmuramoyl-L-alanine--D-glutamate ligase [Clostridia bacterium]